MLAVDKLIIKQLTEQHSFPNIVSYLRYIKAQHDRKWCVQTLEVYEIKQLYYVL